MNKIMNNNKLISVIIPVYNVEKYLRQCLNSVISQTYRNLEIILIDDGSTDNSWKICDEYAKKDERIKVFHQKNLDLSAARNSGLKIAKWEYIWYVDSDDYIELDMYEKLYNQLEETDSDLVICNRYIGKQDWTWKKNNKFPHKQIITSNEALEYFYDSMYVRNKLYKRIWVENLLFVETFAQDVIYNFTLLKKIKKIACIDECLNYYRYNCNSRQHTKKFRKDRLIFLEKWINEEIKYAKAKNLIRLEKKLIDARYGIILKRFRIIALNDYDVDENDLNKLLELVKQDIYLFLKSKRNIVKKIFILVVCVDFKLASLIYKIIYKLWLYKEDL